jgi:pimeloyl-ACP methyl ester carboxylesterase
VILHSFGDREAQLFGVFDPAASPRLRRGVLLLHPAGWEYVRAHRTMRLLASRLAAAGIDAFRFDYRGTGDSWGDDDETLTLEDWVRDAEEAAEELQALAGVARVSLVGLRAGARVALEVMARRTVPVDRVVLWDALELDRAASPSVKEADGSVSLERPALRTPPAVERELGRHRRSSTITPPHRLLRVQSEGAPAALDLVGLEAEPTLSVAGCLPCWIEERHFGAGAVPAPLIEGIVTWLRN